MCNYMDDEVGKKIDEIYNKTLHNIDVILKNDVFR